VESVETILRLALDSLIGLLIVMMLKELGVPVPIPADLLMITAGVRAATGAYPLVGLVVAVEIALLLGCVGQFALVRRAGRQWVYRVAGRLGLTEERLDRAIEAIMRSGPRAVIVGLNIPGARSAVTPSAALAAMPYRTFTPAMLVGSSVYYGWHIAVGYALGPTAELLFQRYNTTLLVVMVGLAALGLIVLVLRRRRQHDVPETLLGRVESWTHAACPACLAITALRRDG
jgi:membrane protein DedA with SNARE-associated domain